MPKTMKCGCRWDGWSLRRCGRHREAGSLAVDLVPDVERSFRGRTTAETVVFGQVPDWLIESAFRHALGQRTHVVGDTVTFLLAIWDQLPARMRSRIYRDAARAMRLGAAGDACDVRQWERLVAWEEAGSGQAEDDG